MRFGNSSYYFGLDHSSPFIRAVKSRYWSGLQSTCRLSLREAALQSMVARSRKSAIYDTKPR